MKQLLNTLFVTSEDIYLSLEGENVLANRDKTVVARYPLHTLQAIVSFSYAGASPALMGKCAEAGIGLAFCSPHGRFLARTCGESSGNVLLRREQYRVADDPARSCAAARTMIFGKLSNGAASIQRTLRDHAPRVAGCGLEDAAANIRAMLPQVLAAADLDSLRGIEGAAATAYFSVLDHMLLSRKEAFFFHGRSRRPPLDRVNAMLSFAYSLLAHDCASALESVGLDSYVGFLHRDRPGRQSLALDLMEELRPCMADRFVLTLVNNRMLRPEDFQMQDSGAVLLSDEGRRKFLKTWQERKRDTLTHPYLGEKLSWGMVPYVQALLLARCLRGDLDGYPPFLWKRCYAGADHIRCKHRGRRRTQAPAANCQKVHGLWTAGAKFRVRVPAGRRTVPPPAGTTPVHHGSREGQSALLLSGEAIREKSGAFRCEEHLPAGGSPDPLTHVSRHGGGTAHGHLGRAFPPLAKSK